MQGAHAVIDCSCPSFHSALGRRKEANATRHAARVKTGRRANWNRPVTTPEMARKAAEGLRGLKPTQALREAGYPPATVHHAKAGINKMIRAELKSLGRKYIEIGRDLSPEDQELIVRGKLLENVILGTDKGVLSAKQLGADRRVAMWTPDSQVGMVVLSPPPIPKISHEIPLVEVKRPEKDSKG